MRLLGLLVLVACSAQPKPADPPAGSGSARLGSATGGPEAEHSGTAAKRCLPVVSKECGCVYTCGVGAQRGDHWFVTHEFWKGSELKAVVEPWCVDSACTDAFAAVIICDGICPRKPADPTCHFDPAGNCVGRSP